MTRFVKSGPGFKFIVTDTPETLSVTNLHLLESLEPNPKRATISDLFSFITEKDISAFQMALQNINIFLIKDNKLDLAKKAMDVNASDILEIIVRQYFVIPTDRAGLEELVLYAIQNDSLDHFNAIMREDIDVTVQDIAKAVNFAADSGATKILSHFQDLCLSGDDPYFDSMSLLDTTISKLVNLNAALEKAIEYGNEVAIKHIRDNYAVEEEVGVLLYDYYEQRKTVQSPHYKMNKALKDAVDRGDKNMINQINTNWDLDMTGCEILHNYALGKARRNLSDDLDATDPDFKDFGGTYDQTTHL